MSKGSRDEAEPDKGVVAVGDTGGLSNNRRDSEDGVSELECRKGTGSRRRVRAQRR